MRIVVLPLLLLMSSYALAWDGYPYLRGKDLNGIPMDIDDLARKKPVVVIMGFTKASADQTRIWEDALRVDLDGDTRVAVVLAVMIGKAPSFIRPMIRRSLKKRVAPEHRGLTLLVEDNIEAWEAYFGDRTEPDRAFVFMELPTGMTGCVGGADAGAEAKAAMLKCIRAKVSDPWAASDVHIKTKGP